MRSMCRHAGARLWVAPLLVALLAGCAATRERRGSPEQSGFLRDYSQLAPRKGFDEAEVYINPRADWPKYDSIQLDSVTVWVTKDQGKIPEEDRQMLTDMLFHAMHEALSSQFKISHEPGPSVLRIRLALTEAKGANVAIRTMTTVVPQLRAATALGGLSADTAVTVGSATVEAELLDSITLERMAAVVDSRAGNKALLSERSYKTWGDVKAAFEFWANSAATHLTRVGVRRKPGAKELEAN